MFRPKKREVPRAPRRRFALVSGTVEVSVVVGMLWLLVPRVPVDVVQRWQRARFQHVMSFPIDKRCFELAELRRVRARRGSKFDAQLTKEREHCLAEARIRYCGGLQKTSEKCVVLRQVR